MADLEDVPIADDNQAVFVQADMTAFQRGGLLWAVNQFVLWPLGLALTVTYDADTDSVKDQPIELREWVAPDGHLETIEDASEQPDFDRWLAFNDIIEIRLAKMPAVEREAAARRLAILGVGVTMGTGRVVSRETTRPRANWVPQFNDNDAPQA